MEKYFLFFFMEVGSKFLELILLSGKVVERTAPHFERRDDHFSSTAEFGEHSTSHKAIFVDVFFYFIRNTRPMHVQKRENLFTIIHGKSKGLLTYIVYGLSHLHSQ